MLFVYEQLIDGQGKNFVSCTDKNISGFDRFSSSPLVTVIRNYRASCNQTQKEYVKHFYHSTFAIDDSHYVISAAVNHSPYDWCGKDEKIQDSDPYYKNKKSVVEYLSPRYLHDIKKGKAFVLLDQSHEGYQTEWLWSWFHNLADRYQIMPSQFIYVTGNLNSEDDYIKWANHHKLDNKICVIPYAHFENVIGHTAYNYNKGIVPMFRTMPKLPTVESHIKYKTQNIQKIKTFNILQKRARAHRIWLFKKLFDKGLIENNIVSMNTFTIHNSYFEGKSMTEEEATKLISMTPMLPPENPFKAKQEDFESSDCGKYLTLLNENIMLDTWCTVVSEALFDNSTCFISEKTFKPIACMHPFIIYGNRGSLARLRELGYKTFSPYIDESYDELDTWERIEAISNELLRIQSLSDTEKIEWFKGMKDILEHNFNTLITKVTKDVLPPVKKLVEYIDSRRN